MHVQPKHVVRAVRRPAIRYPSGPGYPPGRIVSVAGAVAVVHTLPAADDGSVEVITVLWHGAEGRTAGGDADWGVTA